MSVDVLGEGLDNVIHAVFEGTGVVGGRERIIRRNLNAVFVGKSDDACNVTDAERGIAGSLEVDKLGVGLDCSLYLFESPL